MLSRIVWVVGFSFITLKISCHSLLACRVSAEKKSADSLMGVSLYIGFFFPLVAFNILSLIFVILVIICLGVLLFGLFLYGTLCTSWTWVLVSFTRLGKFSANMSSNMFSDPFSLSIFSVWDLFNGNISVLDVSEVS